MKKLSKNLKFLSILGFFFASQNCFAPEDGNDEIPGMLPVKEIPVGWNEKVSSYDSNTHVAINPANPSQKIFTIRFPTNNTFAQNAELNRIATEKFDEELKIQNERRDTPGFGLNKYQDVEDWDKANELYPYSGPQPEGWKSIIPKASKKKKSKKNTENSPAESDFIKPNIERVVSLQDLENEMDVLSIPLKRTSMPSQEDNEAEIQRLINDSVEAFRDDPSVEGRQEFISGALKQMDELEQRLNQQNNLQPEIRQAFLNQIAAFNRLPEALNENEKTMFLKILKQEKANREPTPSTPGISSQEYSSKQSSLNFDNELIALQTKIISQNQLRLEQEAAKKKAQVQRPSDQTLEAVQFAAQRGTPGIPQSPVSSSPRQVFSSGIPGVPQDPYQFLTKQSPPPPQTKQKIHTPQGFHNAAGYKPTKQ